MTFSLCLSTHRNVNDKQARDQVVTEYQLIFGQANTSKSVPVLEEEIKEQR